MGPWTWLLLHVLTLLVPFVRVLWLIILWKKMIFSVFLLTSFTLGGHVGVWLTVTFRTVHIASTICKRAFSLRLIHFQERFQKRSSYCVDGLAKTHRNERFFQRSAVAWTGPFDDGLLWSFSFHIERCLFSFLDQFGFQFSNKLVRNNVSKDNSLHQYLVLNILPNPLWVTLTKNFWGKSPPPISLFIYYSLKFKLVPLLNS